MDVDQIAVALAQPPRIEETDGSHSAIADWKITRVQIAEDSSGRPVFWRPAGGSLLLVVGRAASGKTMTLQNIATQLAREHWAVHIAARRAAEYQDFKHWPNVCGVATGTREHAALIHHLSTLMRIRQNSGDQRCAPVVLVIDSLPEVIGALAGADSPAVAEIEQLLRLGRALKIHVVAGADMTVVGALACTKASSMSHYFLDRLLLAEAPNSARLADRNLGELRPSRSSYPEIDLNELTSHSDGGEVAVSRSSRWRFLITSCINRLRLLQRSEQGPPNGHRHG